MEKEKEKEKKKRNHHQKKRTRVLLATSSIDVDEEYNGNHFVFHKVTKEDTISNLLKKYSITICELRIWNDIKKEIQNINKILVINEEYIVQIKDQNNQMIRVPACHSSTNVRVKAKRMGDPKHHDDDKITTKTTTAASISTSSVLSSSIDVDEVYDGNHFVFHTAMQG